MLLILLLLLLLCLSTMVKCDSSNFLAFNLQRVDWIQCDDCQSWLHSVCAGVSADSVAADKEFWCYKCVCRRRVSAEVPDDRNGCDFFLVRRSKDHRPRVCQGHTNSERELNRSHELCIYHMAQKHVEVRNRTLDRMVRVSPRRHYYHVNVECLRNSVQFGFSMNRLYVPSQLPEDLLFEAFRQLAPLALE